MSTIVVPTIRESHIKAFLEAWKLQFEGHRVIVVEDHPKRMFTLPKWVEHYSHDDIDQTLGEDSHIISRRSSAIRNFGTLKALEKTTDMVWHLDDDCLPQGGELAWHQRNLSTEFNVPSWFSTDRAGQHLRGMPYLNRQKKVTPVLSHGTWLKNPDYDAIHQLAKRFDFDPYNGIVPLGQYFSICGMNVAFKPQVAEALYFAPSGPEQPYDRVDDIWMGVIAKRVFDHCRLSCYTGYPQIIHDRASDPFKNVVAEAPGMIVNEHFWEYIDELPIYNLSVPGCIDEIATSLCVVPYNGENYFKEYGFNLKRWISQCDNMRKESYVHHLR